MVAPVHPFFSAKKKKKQKKIPIHGSVYFRHLRASSTDYLNFCTIWTMNSDI